ncbi:ABC transporter ATP-binding protein [Bauldia litoralis]|uniref:Carbohydrate ABC transporter ATP-binding protein, CUT1 family (TC 3.A.1.1.-) n=1 Tax=Bauldia litoralis TaxID=665467 RepID=A0A1G6D6H5_9HYPH|nr:sn-glycerol-3-phosphate ABC transporter ATP-binding protein UgpC [Bauldia litoralis]SDB40766.1 carbohydrate ABC transporter ATP-binding protein, CUT1 family (TC 3.A.1.1.-) [Bauldia litoralis]
MGQIELRQVRKAFGAVEVIKGVDLTIADNEFVIFVGPSGCGKSTLLRLISGLEEATDGAIVIDGEDVTGKPPAERELSMVFQSYALYPHKTVRENMGFALTVARMPKAEIAARVDRAADVLKLEALLDRRPKALSGGQRQRVAIGRAIVREPKAFLFDEPLSNLDAALRVEMRLEIAKLHRRLDATMVYVTHDQVEAMTLADKIVVLQAGRIEQVGAPIDLYMRPANLFVAQFIGSPKMNVADCQPAEGGLAFANGQAMSLPAADAAARKIGIRPEHINLAPPEESDVTGVIDVIEQLGSDTFVYVEVDKVGLFTVRLVGHVEMTEGEPAGLRFDRDHIHLFGADDRALAP